MTQDLTLRKVGNSTGLTFPKAMLERFGLEAGSKVFATDTPDGILISVHDPDFAEAMALYEEGAERYKNALKELAQ